MMIRNCDRIKFTHRIVAFQNTARIFPSYSRTGFNLRPRNFCIFLTNSSFCYEIENATFSFCISWIPVLYGRIFNLGIIHREKLNNCRVQLIFISRRSCTPFKVRNITSFISNKQSSFKLPTSRLINSEIGGKFHRTFHPFWNITKTSVRKYC